MTSDSGYLLAGVLSVYPWLKKDSVQGRGDPLRLVSLIVRGIG